MTTEKNLPCRIYDIILPKMACLVCPVKKILVLYSHDMSEKAGNSMERKEDTSTKTFEEVMKNAWYSSQARNNVAPKKKERNFTLCSDVSAITCDQALEHIRSGSDSLNMSFTENMRKAWTQFTPSFQGDLARNGFSLYKTQSLSKVLVCPSNPV